MSKQGGRVSLSQEGNFNSPGHGENWGKQFQVEGAAGRETCGRKFHIKTSQPRLQLGSNVFLLQPVCHEAENSSSDLVLPSCSHPQPGLLRYSVTGPIARLPTLQSSLLPAPRDCSKPKPSSSCPALKPPMAPYCLPDPNQTPWVLHIIPARPMSLHPLLSLGASHNVLSFMPLRVQFPLLGTPSPQCSSTSMVTPPLHVPCLPFT